MNGIYECALELHGEIHCRVNTVSRYYDAHKSKILITSALHSLTLLRWPFTELKAQLDCNSHNDNHNVLCDDADRTVTGNCSL